MATPISPFNKSERLRELVQTSEGARCLAQFAFDAGFGEEAVQPQTLYRGYRALRILGEGASGTVFLATHPGTQQLVAFKLFDRLGQKAADRARREMEVLADLRLDCVPRVRDFGQEEGRCFLATDYVEGTRLDDYCRSRNLTLQAKVELLRAIAQAVQNVHDRGVLHRDLKPSNIIIRTDGTPVIVDFGIARLVEADASEVSTREGQPLGTPAFMSPEQARGDLAQVTVRSDVYSLGALGFWMLSGHTAVDVDCAYSEALRRIADQVPRRLRDLYPPAPPDLAEILERALDPVSEARQASAQDFAHDLSAYLCGAPLAWTHPSAWRRGMYWLRTHRRIAAVAAVCLLGYAAAGVAAVVAVERNARAERGDLLVAAQKADLEQRDDRLFDQHVTVAGWQQWYERQYLPAIATREERTARLLDLLERLAAEEGSIGEAERLQALQLHEEFRAEAQRLRQQLRDR